MLVSTGAGLRAVVGVTAHSGIVRLLTKPVDKRFPIKPANVNACPKRHSREQYTCICIVTYLFMAPVGHQKDYLDSDMVLINHCSRPFHPVSDTVDEEKGDSIWHAAP